MRKRGELLIENVIFIILNILFLGIMIIFLVNQSSGVAILEEKYSKQIALLIDSSKPGMIMEINMAEVYDKCKQKKFPFSGAVIIAQDEVTVKIGQNGGYSYHFFNSVDVGAYPVLNEEDIPTGNYILTINENEK